MGACACATVRSVDNQAADLDPSFALQVQYFHGVHPANHLCVSTGDKEGVVGETKNFLYSSSHVVGSDRITLTRAKGALRSWTIDPPTPLS